MCIRDSRYAVQQRTEDQRHRAAGAGVGLLGGALAAMSAAGVDDPVAGEEDQGAGDQAGHGCGVSGSLEALEGCLLYTSRCV